MRCLRIGVAALSALAAGPAAAQTFALMAGTPVSYSLTFNGFAPGSPPLPGLSSVIAFSYVSTVGYNWNFSYSITNSSSLASRVSSFGFDVAPDPSGGSASGAFTNLYLNASIPGGGDLDVCVKGGGSAQNCTGGANSGVGNGTPGTGTLTLAFDKALSTISLDSFFVRYQSIEGAGKITSAIGAVTAIAGGNMAPPTAPVSEPAPVATSPAPEPTPLPPSETTPVANALTTGPAPVPASEPAFLPNAPPAGPALALAGETTPPVTLVGEGSAGPLGLFPLDQSVTLPLGLQSVDPVAPFGPATGDMITTAFSPQMAQIVATVPGPIAGAGLPALMALGGLVWARRRRSAAR